MRCADCQAGVHNHRGECRGPVAETVYVVRGTFDPIGTPWSKEVIGLCQCIDDSEMIEIDRKLQVDALRTGIHYVFRECLDFTMVGPKDQVVVYGDADTQDMAETLFEHLKREGWIMLNGGVPDGS